MEFKKVTEEMRNKLRAKLPDAAVKQHPTKTFLSAIKPIYVTERLNDVFGVGSWKLVTEPLVEQKGEKGMIVVKTTLTIEEYNIHLESFGGNDNGGENSKNFDIGDAYKGATTDGLTKVCSYLEIGIDVFKGLHSHAQTPTGGQQAKPAPKSDPKKEDKKAQPGAMTPNESFELPVGFTEDLNNVETFEDLLAINKKYKDALGVESIKIIAKEKMEAQFAKLPESEQAKKPAKK